MKRLKLAPILIVALVLVAVAFAAVTAQPASAFNSVPQSACGGCHSVAPSGTVTATPSTTTPAAGATYTVSINIGLTAAGANGFWISNGAGTNATGNGATANPRTATMTAPAAAGSYTYTVWAAKGPGSSGMARSTTYTINVPAPPPAPPVLSSLSPVSGLAGSSVTINGTNLGTSGAVSFSGTAATTTSWTATSITATVPAGITAGAKTVTVTTGGQTSNGLAYTVNAPTANITSLTPTSGPVGTLITIAGANFGPGGVVRIGGVTAATGPWTATSITATVPAGLTAGAQGVVVTPNGGAASNSVNFTVTVPAPAISSLSPNNGLAGSSFVINGNNFGTSGTVSFAGAAATTTSWSNTAITVAVPASATPGGKAVIVTSGGQSSAAATFTVNAAPVPAAPAISSLSPNNGLAGSSFVINGNNFGTSGTVSFAGAAATTTSWSNTAITVAVPASATPGGKAVIVTSGGQSSAAATFTVNAAPVPAAPAISSLSPNNGLAGSSFVINGNNFGTSGTVSFAGAAATTTSWSNTAITVAVPASATPGGKAVIVTSGGQSSAAATFTVNAAPVPAAPAISSLSPNNGLAGSSFVINGNNFGTSGTVSFAGAAATTTSWSNTAITVAVPASATPGGKAVIVTSGGQSSAAATFTVNAAPSGTDKTPPTTVATGATPNGWYNRAVAIRLTATDNAGGSGVASITYSVDGGAPVTVMGSTATVTIGDDHDDSGDSSGYDDDGDDEGASNGPHVVTYHATDVAGNVEAAQALTVNIDTQKPTAKAPRSATAKHGRTATLKYQVNDATPNGGTAKVTIAIKDRRGNVVKMLGLGHKPVNTPLTASFTCSLRPGTYTFYVYATDTAGNTQAAVAKNTLKVYSGS